MSRLVSFSTTDHLRAWLRHGAAALALLFAAPLAAAPSAQLAAEPDALYLGESATVTVRVRGLADGDTPSATLQCDAADIAGPGVSRQSQTTIVNGRVSSSSDTSLSFRVTPHTAGTTISVFYTIYRNIWRNITAVKEGRRPMNVVNGL